MVATMGLAVLASLALADAEDDVEVAQMQARAAQMQRNSARSAADFYGERLAEVQKELRDAEDRVTALAHHNDRLADESDDLRDKLHKLAHGEPLS